MVYSKEDEVDGLKNLLNIKNDPKQILEDEATGPDINEVSATKKLISFCPFPLPLTCLARAQTTSYLPPQSRLSTSCKRQRYMHFVKR